MNNEVNETNDYNENTEPQTSEQQAAPQPEPQPAPKAPYVYPPIQPIRRIGTLTMGFALVATGIIALLATFWRGFDLVTVLKLSPVLFIFLGIEILVAHIRHHGERLRYDFLSGFVCFLLICGGLTCSFIPVVWNYVGPESWQMRNQMELAVEDDLYARLEKEPYFSSLSVNAEIPFPINVSLDEKPETYFAATHTNATVSLKGPYADVNAFAQDCHSALAKMRDTPYTIRWVNVYYRENGRDIYSIGLSGRHEMRLDVSSIAHETSDMRAENELVERREELNEEFESRQEELDQRREQLEQEYLDRQREFDDRQQELDDRANSLNEQQATADAMAASQTNITTSAPSNLPIPL